MTDDNQPLNAEGAGAQQAEANLGDRRLREEIERGLSFGLEAAPTINDRTISTFVRGEKPHFAGERGTFLKCPFMEDVNQVDDAEVNLGVLDRLELLNDFVWRDGRLSCHCGSLNLRWHPA